jgi:aspartyl/asparaginyl-tRNA synthetase
MKLIQPSDYHKSVKVLRSFFESKGFVEVPVQSRLSILAACEDPTTVGSFTYSGQVWPLPQTGQMWLEYELLKNKYDKVFCQSTSYRQEPNPIEGRHDLIFPMFEFESIGDVNDLMELEKELLKFMGFYEEDFKGDWYSNLAEKYGTQELSATEEELIWKDYGSVFFLQQFPEYTSPFWNMKRNTETGFANKVDVLLYGMETIGSAEREVDTQIMNDRFHSISDGYYADLLYSQFGKERVEKELNDFLSLEMKPRFGGGIGMTRFIRAYNLLLEEHNHELGRS